MRITLAHELEATGGDTLSTFFSLFEKRSPYEDLVGSKFLSLVIS